MTSLLFLAAGASVCLAAGIWLVLVAARAVRRDLAGRSRRSRDRAARALARFENDRDVAALARALRSMRPELLAAVLARRLAALDPAVRQGIEAALARTGFAKRIAARLASAPEGLRLLYVELLPEIGGGSGAIRTLERSLDDRSPLVRIGAALSLARLAAAPAPRALLARLGPSACASSRLALLLELMLPGREREIVGIAADRALHARIRLSALEALSLAGHDLHALLLPRLAGDPSPAVAAEVARSLPPAHGDAAPVLTGLLGHSSSDVRREAAQAAGAAGSAQLMFPLRRLLVDEDPTVASSAARSLSDRLDRRRISASGGAA